MARARRRRARVRPAHRPRRDRRAPLLRAHRLACAHRRARRPSKASTSSTSSRSALADVWAERPLVIHARYRGAGTRHRRPARLPAGPAVRAAPRGHPARARGRPTPRSPRCGRAPASTPSWTRTSAPCSSGDVPAERRERIVALALAHRLMTQFTSFVAVEERVMNEGGRQRTVAVPVEMPDGVALRRRLRCRSGGRSRRPRATARFARRPREADGTPRRRRALANATAPRQRLERRASAARRRGARFGRHRPHRTPAEPARANPPRPRAAGATHVADRTAAVGHRGRRTRSRRASRSVICPTRNARPCSPPGSRSNAPTARP